MQNDLQEQINTLMGQRKNAQASQNMADTLLSQNGLVPKLFGTYFAAKAYNQNKHNAPIENQLNALLGQLNEQKALAAEQRQRAYDIEDADFKNQAAAAIKQMDFMNEYQKEQRQRGYQVEDRNFQARAAEALKQMDFMQNYQNSLNQPSEFDKELQKNRANQYSDLSEKISRGKANLATLKNTIDRALELNKQAIDGWAGNARQGVANFFGGGQAGAELKALMQGEMVGQLKNTFGGTVSEGEREVMNQLYGADLSMNEGAREALIRNVYQTALNRVQNDIDTFNNLYGGPGQQAQAPVNQAALNNYAEKYGL